MIRVVKVGGSLLTWDALPKKLTKWLAEQPPALNVMIAGGGPWADLLRDAANRFDLSEPSAHAMCVQAMSVTATLLADLVDCECERSYEGLNQRVGNGAIVFDVQAWLLDGDAEDLPKSWDVTSDSIAARLAKDMRANEFVLLKSCDAESQDPAALVASNYVDGYFSTIASNLPTIRYVNLRQE